MFLYITNVFLDRHQLQFIYIIRRCIHIFIALINKTKYQNIEINGLVFQS